MREHVSAVDRRRVAALSKASALPNGSVDHGDSLPAENAASR
jgi:hypothetical protein